MSERECYDHDDPEPWRCRYTVHMWDGSRRCMLPVHGSQVVHRLPPQPQPSERVDDAADGEEG